MRRGIHIVYQFAFSVIFTAGLCLGSVWSPSVANATEYYVATGGNDANPGTESQPFRNISTGVRVLQPGDTLYIRGGTYAETISPATMTIPSGTSWSNAITISGYPNETVTITGIVLNDGANLSYVILNNLVLNPTGLFIGSGSDHIRLSNSEINAADSSDMGVFFGVNANYNELINCSVHNAVYHGLYITSSNNLFDGTRVYNNGVTIFFMEVTIQQSIIMLSVIARYMAMALGERATALLSALGVITKCTTILSEIIQMAFKWRMIAPTLLYMIIPYIITQEVVLTCTKLLIPS
jgi:hypothetical protein